MLHREGPFEGEEDNPKRTFKFTNNFLPAMVFLAKGRTASGVCVRTLNLMLFSLVFPGFRNMDYCYLWTKVPLSLCDSVNEEDFEKQNKTL